MGRGGGGGGGEEGQKTRLFVARSGRGRRVQEEPFLLDGFLFSSFGCVHNHTGAVFVEGTGTVEGVGYEGRDGAENERGEVEDAGRENLVVFPRRERRNDDVVERVDAEILAERVSSFEELETRLFFDGWDVSVGFCRFRGRG